MKFPKASLLKRICLLVMLAAACLALSACYMEPDRVVDANNGLTVGNNSQSFDTVITPTPTVTVTATPRPTSNQVDWSSWDFSANTATNPPSNVAPTAGSISVPTAVPSIITATLPPQSSTTATPRPTTSTSSSSSTTSTTTVGSLKLGSEGTDVKRLQQQLKKLGYYTGSVDGKFGQGTETAVRNFQYANKLTVDGKAGANTQKKLYSSSAKKMTASTATAPPVQNPGNNTSSSSSSSSSSSTSSSSTSSQNTATMYTNGKTDIYLDMGTSNSSQVKIMQNRLIVLGYLTGTADGQYGETTMAAVKAFQERNDLWADGVAGPDTLARLYSSSARKASGAVAHLGSLREGTNGDAVRTLQRNLSKLGYYTGSIDGDYGAGTLAAVKAFQEDHGLKADGIAGTTTLNALERALNGGSTSSSNNGSTSSSSSGGTSPENYGKTASSNGYKTISTSSSTSSSEVTSLQSALRSNGYYSGKVDGDFGSGTEDAVKKYQRAAGLRVTGMAGPSTQRLLYGGTGETGSYKKLQTGSSGSDVKRLQYALYELKYYDGNITGEYDHATETAVMNFQEVNSLYVDGIAGQDTQRKLFSSNAVPSNI